MIHLSDVHPILLAHLRAGLDADVGALTAPNPAPAIYHVLDYPAGSSPVGTTGAPEAERSLIIRVRTVAKATVETAALAALDRADDVDAVLLGSRDRIYGTGWEVTGRELHADSGAIVEGPVANVVRDYRLHIARADTVAPA